MSDQIEQDRIELAGHGTRVLATPAAAAEPSAGDAPPLLFLHGFSDSADTWRPMLERLAERGRRALALDLPGFGEAGRLDRERGVLEQLDEFVAAAVAREHERSGERPVVVGNSMGGAAALRAAADGSLPLAGIVPVAPAGFDHPRWFRMIETAPFVRLVLRTPLPLPEPVVRQAIGRAYQAFAFNGNASALDPAYTERFTSHIRSRRDVIRVLATGRRLMADLSDAFQLERVECPVLLVWGDHDRMVSHSGAERLVEGVPHTEVEILEGCGHCPQLEQPDRMVELVERFAAHGLAAATT